MDLSIKLLFLFLLFISCVHGKKITLNIASEKTDDFIDINCHYALDLNDFVNWGCPNIHPEDPKGQVGFWSPCISQCSIAFFAGLTDKPKSISIVGNVKGFGRIHLFGQQGLVNSSQEELRVISETEGWNETIIDVSTSTKSNVRCTIK